MRVLRLITVLLLPPALVLAAPATTQANPIPGQTNWLSKTSGAITTNPNGTRSTTLTVSPSMLTVKPLDRLGWKDRDPVDEPHLWVFTTDSAKVLGRTIDDGHSCSLCDTAKAEMASALAANPSATRVEHGRPGGLDVEGDAYLLRVDDDVWARVLAPSGAILYYLDAYHPWVYAQVKVGA